MCAADRLRVAMLAVALLVAASPPAAGGAATTQLDALAMALLPPAFTVDSIVDDSPPPAPRTRLFEFCTLLMVATVDICTHLGPEGDFAREMCPECSPLAASFAHRAPLQQGPQAPLPPCTQVKDESAMCAVFMAQAEGACESMGFLTVFMRTNCAASCHKCSDGPVLATPAAVRPTCAMAPDTGAACSFFFSSMANPCTLETAGDSFIANFTRTNCQTSCGICAVMPAWTPAEPSPRRARSRRTLSAEPAPAASQPSPGDEASHVHPTPAPRTNRPSGDHCVDLATTSFSCADMLKQDLCDAAWAAALCPASCGYCEPAPASPAEPVQPSPASPAEPEPLLSLIEELPPEPAQPSPVPSAEPSPVAPAEPEPSLPAEPPTVVPQPFPTQEVPPSAPTNQPAPEPAQPASVPSAEPTPSPAEAPGSATGLAAARAQAEDAVQDSAGHSSGIGRRLLVAKQDLGSGGLTRATGQVLAAQGTGKLPRTIPAGFLAAVVAGAVCAILAAVVFQKFGSQSAQVSPSARALHSRGTPSLAPRRIVVPPAAIASTGGGDVAPGSGRRTTPAGAAVPSGSSQQPLGFEFTPEIVEAVGTGAAGNLSADGIKALMIAAGQRLFGGGGGGGGGDGSGNDRGEQALALAAQAMEAQAHSAKEAAREAKFRRAAERRAARAEFRAAAEAEGRREAERLAAAEAEGRRAAERFAAAEAKARQAAESKTAELAPELALARQEVKTLRELLAQARSTQVPQQPGAISSKQGEELE